MVADRFLGLSPGSKIEWFESGREVIVRRASKHSSRDIHEAVLEQPVEHQSVACMDEGIRSRSRGRQAPG